MVIQPTDLNNNNTTSSTTEGTTEQPSSRIEESQTVPTSETPVETREVVRIAVKLDLEDLITLAMNKEESIMVRLAALRTLHAKGVSRELFTQIENILESPVETLSDEMKAQTIKGILMSSTVANKAEVTFEEVAQFVEIEQDSETKKDLEEKLHKAMVKIQERHLPKVQKEAVNFINSAAPKIEHALGKAAEKAPEIIEKVAEKVEKKGKKFGKKLGKKLKKF